MVLEQLDIHMEKREREKEEEKRREKRRGEEKKEIEHIPEPYTIHKT